MHRKSIKHVSVCMFINLYKYTLEYTYFRHVKRIPLGYFHLLQMASEINRVLDHGG